MIYLVRRNLLVFFRDRGAVFFSLLAVFIIFGLYILFLGDVTTAGMANVPGAKYLVDAWIASGLLAVTPVTASLGAMGVLIDDKRFGIYRDFAASPVKRSRLATSYLTSGFLVSLILTLLTLVLGLVYLFVRNGTMPGLVPILKALGLVLLSALTSTLMMFYLVSWFKSANAFSAASTVLGTLIGFLTDIYIPIGNLPSPVQTLSMIFPPTHGALLFRRILMEEAEVVAFRGAPVYVMEDFRLHMGLAFKVKDKVLDPKLSLVYLIIFLVIFFFLNLSRFKKKL